MDDEQAQKVSQLMVSLWTAAHLDACGRARMYVPTHLRDASPASDQLPPRSRRRQPCRSQLVRECVVDDPCRVGRRGRLRGGAEPDKIARRTGVTQTTTTSTHPPLPHPHGRDIARPSAAFLRQTRARTVIPSANQPRTASYIADVRTVALLAFAPADCPTAMHH